MGSTKTVSSVVVKNREDCCQERLTNYQIHVGDNPNVFANPACPGVFTGNQVVACSLRGRYVGVTIPGENQMLTLCEVEAYEKPLNKINPVSVSQSSDGYTIGTAKNAVDGRIKCGWDWNDNSVTHTTLEANPWWKADFGKQITLDKLTTYNRADCCGERLANYQISVGNNPNVFLNPVCAGLFNGAQTIDCKLKGQYVGLFMLTTQYLSLCEVEFFGSA